MRRPVILLLACAAATGCGNSEDSDGDAAVRAVATTSIAGDLVEQVGGPRVVTRTLLDRDADPHEYEPTPGDARALAGADVVFASGGDVDAWLGDVIEGAAGQARTVSLIDSAAPSATGDPHWWQNPRNVERVVAAIARELGRIDAAGRDTYARRARAYTRRLRELDAGVAACLRRVPARRRKLVTTHEGLGQFARRYGIEVVGTLITSLSTQAQPSARDLERLVDRIRSSGATAIFPESALDRDLERAVAREAGVRVGQPLFADALGRPGSGAATYLDAMRSNTQRLVAGMTGGRVSCRPSG